MLEEHTTAAVQRYLNGLGGGSTVEPVIRALLDRAVCRLRLVCTNLLFRRYPRLAQPPLNLQPDEVLSGVVERLLKALRSVRPQTVRDFFALANQHIRWELNDVARRLDEQTVVVPMEADLVPDRQSSGSGIGPNACRMLRAIEDLPEAEREVFDLVRIQGIPSVEVAEFLGVSTKTVQRRLSRAVVLLAAALSDLRPS
jgi:RNA polymerase sigma-70 factor (ECF subfamily)